MSVSKRTRKFYVLAKWTEEERPRTLYWVAAGEDTPGYWVSLKDIAKALQFSRAHDVIRYMEESKLDIYDWEARRIVSITITRGCA